MKEWQKVLLSIGIAIIITAILGLIVYFMCIDPAIIFAVMVAVAVISFLSYTIYNFIDPLITKLKKK